MIAAPAPTRATFRPNELLQRLLTPRPKALQYQSLPDAGHPVQPDAPKWVEWGVNGRYCAARGIVRPGMLLGMSLAEEELFRV
jgi:hypothetical protein